LKAGFLGSERGGCKNKKTMPPPLQGGLEGKNQSFRVSRGLEEEARQGKKLNRRLRSNI
jgi:hypothetical protein